MMQERQARSKARRAWAFCLLLSLLLHLALACVPELLPRRAQKGGGEHPRAARVVRVLRSAPRDPQQKEPAAAEPKEAEKAPAAFAKTSADEQQRRPRQADFIGRHDSVASGDDDGPRRHGEVPLPNMAGRESEEVVTFEQERQDGELAHDAKAPATPAPQQPAPLPQPPAEQPSAVARGRADGIPAPADPQGSGKQPPRQESSATAAVNPDAPAPEGTLKLTRQQTDDSLTLAPTPPPAPMGHSEGEAHEPTPARERSAAALYDPALSALAQLPGLRTYERRTRSTGRFVFGSRPSLNVAATPRGQYEAEIYRRIARVWYAACDEHRGDIIPGSITISLRLTRSGAIDSMDLVRRRGASVIQQSFSFGAIRRASLPPMPAEVQQEVIGRLYEMIFTFNFD